MNYRTKNMHCLLALSFISMLSSYSDTDQTENYSDSNFRGFNAAQIDSWFLRASFDADNVPEFSFFTPDDRDRYWQPTLNKTDIYSFNGSADQNRAATGLPFPEFVRLKKMIIYRYNGDNPLLTAEQEKTVYPADMLDRFRFYRFTGDAKVLGIGVSLDQYIMAVDTVSKLVFAYGEIARTEKKFGQIVPIEFMPVEFPRLHRGGIPFYEYDPIGYVNADGSIILYDEYRAEMSEGGAVNYFPSVHDPARAQAGYDRSLAGLSPYYADSDQDRNKDNNRQ